MKQSEKHPTTALGLDVGTSRIVMAHRVGEEFKYETQLNAFVTVPYSKITEGVLKKQAIPHKIQGSEIVVPGNEAEKFAALLHTETRRPMTKGVLNPTEPDSLTLMRQLIESMLGSLGKEKHKLCFTIPAAPLGGEDNLTYHEGTLRQILGDFGSDVQSVNEGLAVIYGELESANYTGIGISCGGGLCNVCLAYLSVPVVSFSIPKAGDYIDSSAAQVTGELANRIRMMKEESFAFNGSYPDQIHQVLGVYYDDMIQALVHGMKEAFASARNMPKFMRPVTIVLSGGTAIPAGFRDRFDKILGESDFPIPLAEVRMATNPLQSAAKGALVAALSEM